MKISEIDQSRAHQFLIDNKAYKQQICINDADHWIGAFVDNQLVGVVAKKNIRGKTRVKAFFVHPQYRHRGIGTELLKAVTVDNNEYSAYATVNSVGLFENLGFVKQSVRQSNNVTYLKRVKNINE